MAAALPSILLVLSVAFAAATIAAGRHSPSSSSDEKQLVKACSEALGPGGASLVKFCADDFLGHKAALLAGCGKQEAASIVAKEAHKKAKVVEDFEEKINSDKSLCEKEHKELKSCWKSMNAAISSVGKIYDNIAVKKLSADAVMEELDEKVTEAMGKCRFSTDGRHGGLWSEFNEKAEASLKAQVVALAFMDKYHSV